MHETRAHLCGHVRPVATHVLHGLLRGLGSEGRGRVVSWSWWVLVWIVLDTLMSVCFYEQIQRWFSPRGSVSWRIQQLIACGLVAWAAYAWRWGTP